MFDFVAKLPVHGASLVQKGGSILRFELKCGFDEGLYLFPIRWQLSSGRWERAAEDGSFKYGECPVSVFLIRAARRNGKTARGIHGTGRV
jgi:hypothetical protein